MNLIALNQFKEKIESIKKEFDNEIKLALDIKLLEQVKNKYLSKDGILSLLTNEFKSLDIESKRIVGDNLNILKQYIHKILLDKKNDLENEIIKNDTQKFKFFDITAYKYKECGSLHPYSIVINEIIDIFVSMGYEIVDGPELETEYNNFEALNIPSNHPARDMQDTFWLNKPGLLMRTHTSSVEVHVMNKKKPPIAIVAPGRCYRNEATDASHDFQFIQCEGLYIGKNVSLANLLATVKSFLQAIFEKKELNIRVRPSYYPFVEPGIDIDVQCPFCLNKANCSTCKNSKWIEIAGAGLTHPNVLKMANIDHNIYSGFAFGFGITRLVMLKYNINDIRLLHNNKLDFLRQF